MNKFVSQAACEFVTGEDRIDIWHVDLSVTDLERPDLLSEDEVARSEKMLHVENKKLFVRSRCALRIILSKCLSLNPIDLSFQYGEKGKPGLLTPSEIELEFNLSHSLDIALIAVASGRQIGIDISHTNRSTNWQGIAKRSFTENEIAYLAPPEDSQHRFHRIWSQKEAYTKALGLGYSYGFKNFSVRLEGGLIHDSLNPDAGKLWTIDSFDSGDNTVAALAFNGNQNPHLHYWKLDETNIPYL